MPAQPSCSGSSSRSTPGEMASTIPDGTGLVLLYVGLCHVMSEPTGQGFELGGASFSRAELGRNHQEPRDTLAGAFPRVERVLRKWHEMQGHPTRGIVLPSHRFGRANGPKAEFVLRHTALSARQVAEAAAKAGLAIMPHHVDVIRSAQRSKGDRKQHPKRYAKGFDWGWADHPERTVTRLGWWRRVGIKRRLRFHDLRDTAATHLLSGSWGPAWSMQEVSKFLGPSSIAVTEQRYAHLARDAKRAAAQSVESDRRFRTPSKHCANTAEMVSTELFNYLKSLAPEAGLEPTTSRLTADR
jgi:hypothetical protein